MSHQPFSLDEDIALAIRELTDATAKHHYAYGAGIAVMVLRRVRDLLTSDDPKCDHTSPTCEHEATVEATNLDGSPVYAYGGTTPTARDALIRTIDGTLYAMKDNTYTARNPEDVRRQRAALIADAILANADLAVGFSIPRFTVNRDTPEGVRINRVGGMNV